MQRPYPGYFITLEGGDGSGKSSQIPQLVEYLREMELNVYPTREPGGTSIGEQIREVIHDMKNIEMHPRTEVLMYQAARAQIVEQVIKPRLKDGEVVVCDRFFDSTIAYQGYGHQLNLERIFPLIQFATEGLVPDMTVLLDVDVEIGQKRKKNSSEWNRLDAFEREFHERVRVGYLKMAKENPNRWVVVDANKTIDEVSVDLKREVENKLIFNKFIEGNKRSAER